MITLKTGLPRNGKTLSVVTELAELLKRWDKHPEERRPVFQFGVTDLVLPGIERIDAWPLAGKQGDPIPLTVDGKPSVPLTFDQGAIPDGALIIIDECQDFFQPRGPSVQAPAHVRALNTHGHRNIDYVLLTQHPKLIDNAVRRLVNKHQHYRRTFGGKSAVTYEWDVCSDSLEYSKAVKGLFRYPSKSFGLYKSASGFVRPKFRLPAFLIVPALAIPLAVWALPAAYRAFSGAAGGTGVGSAAAPASAASASAPVLPGGLVQTAPASRPKRDPFSVAGCFAVGEDCRCFDHRGVQVHVPLNVCTVSSSSFQGIVKWEPRDIPEEKPQPVPQQAAPLAGGAPNLLPFGKV